MKLGIAERFLLLTMLPDQGNMVEMILAKNIKQKTEFTSVEIGDFGIESKELENGSMNFTWDREKTIDVEIYFEKAEVDFLKKQVDKLDAEENITSRSIDLCLKIREL